MKNYAVKPNGKRLTPHEASLLEVLWSEGIDWTTPRRIWERAGALPTCAYVTLNQFIQIGYVETQPSTLMTDAGSPVPEFRLTQSGRIWYRSQMKKSIAEYPFWVMRLTGRRKPATR